MDRGRLEQIANQMVAPGKGILAADESSGTIKKRLNGIHVESTEDNRRAYRGLLFTTPGVEEYISGVILFDETIRQKTDQGIPFPEHLHNRGILPGIKVDEGKIDLPGFPGEKITEGLDGLKDRLEEYREFGAVFTKWRAVFPISDRTPTRYGIRANANALARYAALSQEVGFVPIVEPEVLMDGDHDIRRCEAVTTEVLHQVYDALHEAQIYLEGSLLKPNIVLPGEDSPQQVSPEEVAQATIRTLRRTVPTAVPGIVFLSGGQSAEDATKRLNAMNAMGDHPWELSFSYGRALQGPVLEAWMGKQENVSEAQKNFFHRARMNSLARYGTYTQEEEAKYTDLTGQAS